MTDVVSGDKIGVNESEDGIHLLLHRSTLEILLKTPRLEGRHEDQAERIRVAYGEGKTLWLTLWEDWQEWNKE